ncbi:Late embryogenesis abundant protein [Macleaya cordata]|uniref:Late embryogenesis abundant protein n=1 Tax=Macleaya cordata TaxID=56857 RepID=A0A200R9U4_MACCD|nr:Late embryogenesis abundant protein [Macleaya cordata]
MVHPAPGRGGLPTMVPGQQRRPRLLRCVAITMLTIIALVGLAVLISWLAVRPRRLVYTVEDGKVKDFDLRNNHLNGTFIFILRAYNPNNKVSLYYDSIEVVVSYDDQTIAFDVVEPFYQPSSNVTRFEVKPTARSVPLLGSVSRDLKSEKSSGEMELDIKVKAWIRFKLGIWKSSHYNLRVLCSPVVVHLNSSKTFERTYCDVDT